MTIKLMLPGFVAAREMLLPSEAVAIEAQFKELPPAPWFSPEARQRLEEVEASSQAANTRRNYDGGTRRFTAWCEERRFPSLPAHPEVVGRTTAVGVVQGHFPAVPEGLVAVLTRPSGTALWG